MTKRYDLVIFDCDGVLFDSKEANRRYYNYIATQLGREPLDPQELEYVHMHTAEESLGFIFRDMPQLLERAFSLAEEVGYDPFLPYMEKEPGMEATIANLRRAGVKTAISTNRSTTMPRLRELFGLDGMFDSIVCALDVERPKPHPEGVEKILRHIGIPKEKSVYVGDSAIDQETAQNAAIPLIAYKNDRLDAEYHVTHFREIEDIVLRTPF